MWWYWARIGRHRNFERPERILRPTPIGELGIGVRSPQRNNNLLLVCSPSFIRLKPTGTSLVVGKKALALTGLGVDVGISEV